MGLVWRNASGEHGTKEFSSDPWPDHLSAFADKFKLDVENTFAFASLYQSFFQSLKGDKNSIRGRDESVGVYTAKTLQSMLAASGNN